MSPICWSAILLASFLVAVTSYESSLQKSLWKLTEQIRHKASVTKVRPSRNDQLVTCAGDSFMDLSEWVDKALESFPALKETAYKDINFRKFPAIVTALEGLIYDMVENSQLEMYFQCIYWTWSISYLTFELDRSLLISKVVLASTACHALLHFEDSMACEEQLIEGDSISELFMETYEPVMILQKQINELFTTSGYQQSLTSVHQQVFQAVVQLVHTTDPNQLTAQEVVHKYIEQLCKQLENQDLYQFVEPSCDMLAHGLHQVMSQQLKSLVDNLESNNFESNIRRHFPAVCHPMIKVFSDEMTHDPKFIRLPLELLNTTYTFVEEFHRENADKIDVLRRLMRSINTLDLTSSIEAESLIAHVLSAHLAVSSPVAMETPLMAIQAQELEMVCLELFSQVVYTFHDSCLDYKLVAPLVGIVQLKMLDMTMSNFHFLSIVEQIWRLIKSEHALLDHALRDSLEKKFYDFVRSIYTTKLQHFMSHLEDNYDHIPAFYQAKTVVVNTVVLINKDEANRGTLGELVEQLVLTVAQSYWTDPHTDCVDTEHIYMELKAQIMYLISEMEQISTIQIEVFTESVLADIPQLSKMTQNTLENITKEGLSLLTSYILDDIHILATSLHRQNHHSRVAVANFVGAHLASSLFKVIRYYTTATTMPKPTPVQDVNENLRHIVKWQNEAIGSFMSNYIKGLQDMVLNVGMDSSINLCELSPGICKSSTHAEDQDSHDQGVFVDEPVIIDIMPEVPQTQSTGRDVLEGSGVED